MRMIAVLLCGALAACSQTNTQAPKGAAQSAEKPKVQQTAATREAAGHGVADAREAIGFGSKEPVADIRPQFESGGSKGREQRL